MAAAGQKQNFNARDFNGHFAAAAILQCQGPASRQRQPSGCSYEERSRRVSPSECLRTKGKTPRGGVFPFRTGGASFLDWAV